MGSSTIERALNGTFVLGGAQDGAKKFQKELSAKQPYNEYDNLMDNDMKVVKNDFMGNTNPATINNEASEAIDKIFREKLAYENNAPRNNGFRNNGFRNNNEFNNQRFNKVPNDYNRYSNNQNFNSYDVKKNSENNDYLPYAILGSVAVGLGAYQAYKKGDIMAPITTAFGGVKKGVEKGLLAGPKKILNSNKTSKLFLEAVKQSNKSIKALEDSVPKATRYARKFASEEIDEMYKEAAAEFANKKEFAKTLIKEDFLQNGLRSIPYAAVPIGLSYALNKNLKKDNSPVRGTNSELITPSDKIIIDVPLEEINNRHKKASEEIDELLQEKVAYEPVTMKHWLKYELPRQTVKASSWALFPAALVALTHRNIRGMGEKIDRNDKNLGPVEPGKARITIEAGPSTSNYDYKMASEIIDVMYKEASKDKHIFSAIEEDYLQTIGEKKDEGIPFQRKKITDNIKKQEKMLK